MEALTSVQITLLTIYDMCKAVDKEMTITEIKLLEKTGGKSYTNCVEIPYLLELWLFHSRTSNAVVNLCGVCLV